MSRWLDRLFHRGRLRSLVDRSVFILRRGPLHKGVVRKSIRQSPRKIFIFRLLLCDSRLKVKFVLVLIQNLELVERREAIRKLLNGVPFGAIAVQNSEGVCGRTSTEGRRAGFRRVVLRMIRSRRTSSTHRRNLRNLGLGFLDRRREHRSHLRCFHRGGGKLLITTSFRKRAICIYLGKKSASRRAPRVEQRLTSRMGTSFPCMLHTSRTTS